MFLVMRVLSRRQFVATLAATAPALTISRRVCAAAAAEPRLLRFEHLHTGERLEVEYFSSGSYLRDALDSVSMLPCMSIQRSSRNPVVLTTSVSPDHVADE